MDRLQAYLDRAAAVLVWLGYLLIGMMVVHVVLDIGGRYLFNTPLPGTVEFVAHYYMVGVIFFPLAFVQSGRGHFAVEIFTQRFPSRLNLLLDAVMTLLTALLLLFLAWRTADYAYEFTLVRETVQTAYFNIPTWPSRWVVPLGLGLMALVAVLQSILMLCGRPPAGDAGEVT